MAPRLSPVSSRESSPIRPVSSHTRLTPGATRPLTIHTDPRISRLEKEINIYRYVLVATITLLIGIYICTLWAEKKETSSRYDELIIEYNILKDNCSDNVKTLRELKNLWEAYNILYNEYSSMSGSIFKFMFGTRMHRYYRL